MVFSERLQRAELSSLRDFLKVGASSLNSADANKKYSKRLMDVDKKLDVFFAEKFPDCDEREKVISCFCNLITVYEEVFFEIGAIAGAKIGYQLRGRVDELS